MKSLIDEIMSLVSERVDIDCKVANEIRSEIEKKTREVDAQIRILDSQVRKNEKNISVLTKAHRDLRSYVVADIETRNEVSWFENRKSGIFGEIFNSIRSFSDSHGPIIAYTILLSGLASSITYFVITRM